MQLVTPEKVAERIVCGPDLEQSVAKNREVEGLGFDRIVIHQAGPEQEKFLKFAQDELLPALRCFSSLSARIPARRDVHIREMAESISASGKAWTGAGTANDAHGPPTRWSARADRPLADARPVLFRRCRGGCQRRAAI